MATVMKTPGVYVIEKDAFPNSIVEVATAVPAFIGYTEKAKDKEKSLLNKPRRITSLTDFQKYFGGPPKISFELSRTAVEAAAAGGADGGAADADGDGDADGGAADAGDEGAGAAEAAPYPEGPSEPVAREKNDKGEVVAEYELTRKGDRFHLYHSMVAFFKNGGGPCYVVSVGDYGVGVEMDALVNGLKPLEREQEPTMVVIPDAVLLGTATECGEVQKAALLHCSKMQSRVAIMDVYQGFRARDDGEDCVLQFREKVGINHMNYGVAYYPWLDTSIVSGTDLSFRNIDPDSRDTLIQLLKYEVDLKDSDPDPVRKKKEKQLALIDRIPTSDAPPGAAEADAGADAADGGDGADGGAGDGGADADAGEDAKPQTKAEWELEQKLLNKGLVALSPQFNDLLKEAQAYVNRLPPSGAMAGVYTMVDNTRGVWKAPANVSLNAVVKPAVNISHDEQEDLNVTPTGTSVNAIRSFIGEGTLVWGARTLDGNSLDWRYVNVRRTMIMLEQSIKLAAKAYVFEPNDANTWITIKSMIRNFLTGIWKRGGLAGASPDDAFSVHVGLGETMTPEDILEGILRVTVLVAPTRPAEFIELTFQQQMQKS